MKRTLVCKNRGDKTTCHYKTKGAGAHTISRAVSNSVMLTRGLAKTIKYAPRIAKGVVKTASKAPKRLTNKIKKSKVSRKLKSALK